MPVKIPNPALGIVDGAKYKPHEDKEEEEDNDDDEVEEETAAIPINSRDV